MPEKYQDWLAANVLNDGTIVNYRMLSRALKIHSNISKRMLYEFHRAQNARKPGSLHATYLVTGIPKLEESQSNGHKLDGEDTLMQDDSFMSSSMPEQEEEREVVPVTSITLIREEDLDHVKQLHASISSIHVYSLEPGPLQNLRIISDCNRKIATEFANDDLLESWKQYGTIHNERAKRRTGRRPILVAPSITDTVTAAMKPKAAVATVKASEAPKAVEATKKMTSATTEKKPAPTLKRESSSIMKSFGKTKAPIPKASPAEDSPMADVSDEGDDSSPPPLDTTESSAKALANREARSQRAETLRKMMEDDDEADAAMPDAEPGPTRAAEPIGTSSDPDALGYEDSPVANPDPELGGLEPPTEETHESPQSATRTEADVKTANGRRKGRRRVMKKKTTKDAEGYLVTREEAVWESFSEEEKGLPSTKEKLESVAPKQKKGSGKPGQGNIMSFFGKR